MRSIIIIGAGFAGLAAGIYAQMNGYRTQIFEMHSLPGGLCTSWRRRGYTFDGGVRYLSGTAPEERRRVRQPFPLHNSNTSSKRSGCRGASSRRPPGLPLKMKLKTG